MESGVLSLLPSQVDQAANLLARAFFDDPLTLFTLPDESERAEAMPKLMRAALLSALENGVAHATPGPLDGVALWLMPASLAKARPHRTNNPITFSRLADALPPEAFRRMGLARDALGERQEADVKVDHWHLTIIGVEPASGRRGVGGRLLAPVLVQADDAGHHCYLETYREENLAFYRKHGFDVFATGEVPQGGPRFWTMLRAPLQASSYGPPP